MQANKPRETQPELRLRQALHAAGLRFRKDCRPAADVRCTADVVFTRQRVCVFVDGCFWHGCPEHFVCPKTNAAWWQEKIEDNRRRDHEKPAALRVQGWLVLRYWEHDLAGDGLQQVVTAITAALSNSARQKRDTDADTKG